jgi:hypothetical protein
VGSCGALRFKDCAADQLGDLRNYGVSERTQFFGKPIIISAKRGEFLHPNSVIICSERLPYECAFERVYPSRSENARFESDLIGVSK